MLEVTAVEAAGPGWVRAAPCDSTDTTSTVNFRDTSPVPNVAVVVPGADGTICVTSSVATHLIVDRFLQFGDDSEVAVVPPKRVLDTRESPGTRIDGGGVAVLDGAALGVTDSTTGVMLNLTTTDPAGGGFLTAYPCLTGRPTTSNLNFTPGDVVANFVIVEPDASGDVFIYAHSPPMSSSTCSAPCRPASPAARRNVCSTREPPTSRPTGRSDAVGGRRNEPAEAGRLPRLWWQNACMIFDGFVHQLPDIDPTETQEWLESLDAVVDTHGKACARFLLSKLLDRASASQVSFPATVSTPYVNTIHSEYEPWFPGDEHIERRIRAFIRWNAAMMVVKANKHADGIGGHLDVRQLRLVVRDRLQPLLPWQGRPGRNRPRASRCDVRPQTAVAIAAAAATLVPTERRLKNSQSAAIEAAIAIATGEQHRALRVEGPWSPAIRIAAMPV